MTFKIENLIRGKIAELVFDQMFRHNRQFTVIPFGYDSHDKTQVYLVEVKYTHRLDEKRVLDIATKIHKQWKVVWMFIATPTGFYFDSCKAIIANNGKPKSMDTGWVAKDVQNVMLVTLRKFI